MIACAALVSWLVLKRSVVRIEAFGIVKVLVVEAWRLSRW